MSVFELDDPDEEGITHKQIATEKHFCGYMDGIRACSISAHQDRLVAANENNKAVTVFDFKALQQCAVEEVSKGNQEEGEDDDDSDDSEDYGDQLKSMQKYSDNVVRLSNGMIEGFAEFSHRGLRAFESHYASVRGGPEVVAVRGTRLVAGFADGSVHLQKLESLESHQVSDAGQSNHCSFLPSAYFVSASDADAEDRETDTSSFFGSDVDDAGDEEASAQEYVQASEQDQMWRF